MGQAPTEDELFQMISEVDDNMSGSIDFGEFLKVVESQKNRAENLDDENDMVDAFVACGGQADKSGHVKSKYFCCWIVPDPLCPDFKITFFSRNGNHLYSTGEYIIFPFIIQVIICVFDNLFIEMGRFFILNCFIAILKNQCAGDKGDN